MSEKENMVNKIKTALENIRFGSVEIIVHDSKVVQIERKEKIRFAETTNNPTKGGDATVFRE